MARETLTKGRRAPNRGEQASPSDDHSLRSHADPVPDPSAMQKAIDLPDLFAGLAKSIMAAVVADACLVSLYDEERGCVRDIGASVAPGAHLNQVAAEFSLDDYPVTKRVVESGRNIQIALADPDADGAEKEYLTSVGFARVLITRFTMEGAVTGIVETFRLTDRRFGLQAERDIGTLSTFAANTYARIQTATKLEANYTETLEALVTALEARDPYTQAHAKRIKDMAVALGVVLRIPMEDKRSVRLGAILHDVGKIGISDTILLKAQSLTPDEGLVMETHPEIGERMLKPIDFLAGALPVIRHHHERWDGKGYPDGLAGPDIPIGARIVAVCDAFDAMTSDRPYRSALALDQACEELLAGAETQFDPRCARNFVDLVRAGGDESLESRLVRYIG